MAYPFGIDISKWQWDSKLIRAPDFEKIKAGTSFVLVKSTESWGYIDPAFARNWQGLAGHNRVAYCYVYPESDPSRQANHLIDTVERAGANWDHDRLALDLERSNHGKTKSQVTEMVLIMMEQIKKVVGRYPILYSRKSWVDSNMIVTDSRLANADWWLANYLWRRPAPLYTPEKDPPPALPNGIRRWLIHQTGERGNGSAVGVISHYVDTDRWNGTHEQMAAYFGRSEGTEPEPEPPVSTSIPPLWQRDDRWKNKLLGYSQLTIGGYGCLITTIAMRLGTTPDAVNDRLKAVGGYTGANVYWQMVMVAFSELTDFQYIECYWVPAPLGKIDSRLAEGVPVHVHVDLYNETSSMEQHWVLIVGKEGDDYVMNDPWTGKQGSFRATYGDPARWIFRIASWRKE